MTKAESGPLMMPTRLGGGGRLGWFRSPKSRAPPLAHARGAFRCPFRCLWLSAGKEGTVKPCQSFRSEVSATINLSFKYQKFCSFFDTCRVCRVNVQLVAISTCSDPRINARLDLQTLTPGRRMTCARTCALGVCVMCVCARCVCVQSPRCYAAA